MSQSEALRMSAEVVDGFSGPLKNLRQQLQSLSKEGGVHADTLAKGFSRVEAGARQAERTVSTALNPALATIGVTGLTAGAAIGGIVSAMRNFATSAAGLGALSRETGQTAENLRVLGAVAGRFGIDQEAIAGGTKNFAAQMREFGRGIGETYQWLNRQGRDGAQRRHFQDFAADLRATTDRGEQLRKVITELENIKDPTERAMFAEKFFGNGDFGKLGDQHLGKIADVWKKTQDKLGPLPKEAVESAEQFERAMADLRSSMSKLGTTIGQDLLPYATRFTTWIDEMVANQRGDIMKALREGLQEIRRELDGINWKAAGDDAKAFFTGTVDFAKDLVQILKTVATLLSAVKDLKDGNFKQAFEKLGQADRMTDLGMGQGRAPGTIQDSMRADTGPMMLRQAELQKQIQILDENIGRKESQPDPLGEGRVVASEERAKRDRLIEETKKLGDEIKRLREDQSQKKATDGATVQKSAFGDGTGDGGGLGGLIQKASFGGGGLSGGLGGAASVGRSFGGGGGAGAGYGGSVAGEGGSGTANPRLSGDVAERAKIAHDFFRSKGLSEEATAGILASMKQESNFTPGARGDGGKAHGLFQHHADRRAAILKNTGINMSTASFEKQLEGAWWEMNSGDAGAQRALKALRTPGISARDAGAAFVKNFERPLRDERASRGALAEGILRHFTGQGGGAAAAGSDTDAVGIGSRYLGMNERRDRAALKAFTGHEVLGDLNAWCATFVNSALEKSGVKGTGSGVATSFLKWGEGVDAQNVRRNDVAVFGRGLRAGQRGGHVGLATGETRMGRHGLEVEVLQGNSSNAVKSEWERADKLTFRRGADGGAAFAQDYKRRQAEETDRKGKLQLGKGAQNALQNGAAGQVSADGKVSIHVQTTDPSPKVKSSTEGNLFRDVQQSRGRQMEAPVNI